MPLLNGYQVTDEQFNLALFHYIPSAAAAGVFLALFSLAVRLTVRTKTPFMAWVGVTGLLEVAGYICRLLMLHSPSMGVYIGMSIFLVVTPTLLALTDYLLLLQKIMQVVTGIRLRWLSPRAISNLFLASDIFCFLIQSSGAGIMTSDYNMGINLLLAGLALQLGFFVLFVILALHVHRIYIQRQ